MPAREHVLLSDAERTALFLIPTDPDELARRFTLEKPDLDLIGERRQRNRLPCRLHQPAKARGVYDGKGRKPTIDGEAVRRLHGEKMAPAAIARELGISRASVYRYIDRADAIT